ELDGNSSTDINKQLIEAKKVFNSTDKTDFLKIHSVFKKFFFSYINYMKDSTNVKNGIREQDFLLGKVDQMKSWLQKLDKWFPININGEWKNSAGQCIVAPKALEQVVTALQQAFKFKESPVIGYEGVNEHYIGEDGSKKIIFGLVDMKGAEISKILTNAKTFEAKCPEGCTNDTRTWVCTKCGDYVSKKNTTLYC